MNIKKIAALVALSIGIPCAYAAQYDEQELQGILAEIDKNGAAPVVVNLFNSTLDELFSDSALLARQSHAQTSLLLDELQGGYCQQGVHRSPLGQVEIYLTRDGIGKLMQSKNAASFARGKIWREKTLLNNTDGNLDRIADEIAQQGYAEIEAVLNIDGLDYDIATNGSYTVKPQQNAAVEKRAAALSNLDSLTLKSASSTDNATVNLKIGYQDFIDLVQNDGIRFMRLAAETATPKPYIDESLLKLSTASADSRATAAADTRVDIIVSVRNPLVSGNLSTASLNQTQQVNEDTLKEILAQAGIDNVEAMFASVGAAQIKITREQLQKLLTLDDARIHSIVPNSIVAKPLLNMSTTTINVPLAWNMGFRGAGQMIAVLDNGFRLDHETFLNAQSHSRIAFQACYGTNDAEEGYVSVCPQQDAYGDSPFDLPGSATFIPGENHGTHVAGIAVGSSGVYPGIAPDALFVPVQVFSHNPTSGETGNYLADLFTVFEAGVYETQNSSNYPMTVNASLGGETIYSRDCDSSNVLYAYFSAYVSILKSRQIPVVVASGNGASRRGMPFPACIPHTVKAGSLENDTSLQNISWFTDIGMPWNFTGPIYMAPGSVIVSSGIDSNNAYVGMSGTSMAAPHIAGLLALAKSAVPDATLDDLYYWIDANFTETAYASVCASAYNCTYAGFKAIKIK